MNDTTKSLNPFDAGHAATNPILPSQGGGAMQSESSRGMAEIQSALVIAKRFPRDPKTAVDKILNECTRIGLAGQATYTYSRGGSEVSGPSIRLAEVIARQWGNFQSGLVELSQGAGYSEVMAYAVDLETNRWERLVFHVKHWRDTKSGGYQIKDQRDIGEHILNQGKRRERSCILALIPGDVVDSALEQCDVTLKANVTVTPEKIKSMIEKFAAFDVTKAMIEKRLQRHIETLTPGQMIGMTKIYTSLTDGMSVISDWFDVEAGATARDLSKAAANKETEKEKEKETAPASKKENKAAAPSKKKTAATTDQAETDQETKPDPDAPAQSDQGEILGAEARDPDLFNGQPFTAIDVSAKIRNAKNADDLDLAADMTNRLPDDDKISLRDKIEKRRAELIASVKQ